MIDTNPVNSSASQISPTTQQSHSLPSTSTTSTATCLTDTIEQQNGHTPQYTMANNIVETKPFFRQSSEFTPRPLNSLTDDTNFKQLPQRQNSIDSSPRFFNTPPRTINAAPIFDTSTNSLPTIGQPLSRPFQITEIVSNSTHVEYNRPSFINNNPFLVREVSAPPLGQYQTSTTTADVYSNGYLRQAPQDLDFHHNMDYNERQLSLITQRMNNMNFDQYLQGPVADNGSSAVDSSDKRIHLRYDG